MTALSGRIAIGRRARWGFAAAALSLLASSCASSPPAPTPSTDGGAAGSEPSPPAEITRRGTAGVLLRGIVLAQDRALAPGEVLVAGGLVTCVAASCSGADGSATATVVETHGVISPGLIDAHNHLAYDFLPRWSPGRLFQNRYEWAADPGYEDFIAPYANHRAAGDHFCPAAKWGELRALIHGTTTVQGESYPQSCLDWGVRNAEHFHGLGYRHLRTNIASVRDLDDAAANALVADFDAAQEPTTRYVVHMQEGYAGGNVLAELDSFAGRDPRTNRHHGLSLLRSSSVLVHGMELTSPQLAEIAAAGASVVWSPSSNLALYGRTAPIEKLLEAGITVGLGPDWTLSGEPDLLAELRFARAFAAEKSIAALTSERLWRMATADGAKVVGLDGKLGRIEVGLPADLVVFGRRGRDPFSAVVESRAQDVRLVLIGGVGLYGDASLREATAKNEYCEPFDACGTAKYLCVQESPSASSRKSETLGAIRAQLVAILEGTGYPASEQYHRGDELLELAECAP